MDAHLRLQCVLAEQRWPARRRELTATAERYGADQVTLTDLSRVAGSAHRSACRLRPLSDQRSPARAHAVGPHRPSPSA